MSTNLIDIEKVFTPQAGAKEKELDPKLYENSGLPHVAKAVRAMNLGYRFCSPEDMNKWLRSLKDDTIDRFEGLDMNPVRSRSLGINSLREDPATGRFKVEIFPPFQPEGNPFQNSVAYGFVQKGLSYFHLAIVSSKWEEYPAIPPPEVALSVCKVKDEEVFDYFVVLEPKSQEAILVDPIVCGKINNFPDKFFFVAGWVDDILPFFNSKDVQEIY